MRTVGTLGFIAASTASALVALSSGPILGAQAVRLDMLVSDTAGIDAEPGTGIAALAALGGSSGDDQADSADASVTVTIGAKSPPSAHALDEGDSNLEEEEERKEEERKRAVAAARASAAAKAKAEAEAEAKAKAKAEAEAKAKAKAKAEADAKAKADAKKGKVQKVEKHQMVEARANDSEPGRVHARHGSSRDSSASAARRGARGNGDGDDNGDSVDAGVDDDENEVPGGVSEDNTDRSQGGDSDERAPLVDPGISDETAIHNDETVERMAVEAEAVGNAPAPHPHRIMQPKKLGTAAFRRRIRDRRERALRKEDQEALDKMFDGY